jgi:hypothetical protein
MSEANRPRCKLCGNAFRRPWDRHEAWFVVPRGLVCGPCWARTARKIRTGEQEDRP